MFKKIFQNGREIIGWIIIIAFALIYLLGLNSFPLLKGRTYAFHFLVITTIFILVWLKLNRKR